MVFIAAEAAATCRWICRRELDRIRELCARGAMNQNFRNNPPFLGWQWTTTMRSSSSTQINQYDRAQDHRSVVDIGGHSVSHLLP